MICRYCCESSRQEKRSGPGFGEPNPNGPHHVFVGSLTDAVLQQIQKLLKNRQNNIMIVTTSEELARVPPKMVEKCGVVTDASVQLVNTKDKILMLDDERVISFDYLVTSAPE